MARLVHGRRGDHNPHAHHSTNFVKLGFEAVRRVFPWEFKFFFPEGIVLKELPAISRCTTVV